MHSTPIILVLGTLGAIYLIVDMIIVLRTGHIPGLFRRQLLHRMTRGPVTRKGRPQLFRSYVIGNVAAIVMVIGYLAAALIFS
jgi:hypothetical protein